MIRNPLCDTKKLYHTALLPVQLVLFLERIVVLQSARCCYACETNCNALYYAMPVETTRSAVNQARKTTNLKLIVNIKITIIKAFFLAFSSFCYQRSCLLSDKVIIPCLFSYNTKNINGLGSYHTRLSASCDTNPNH